MSQIFKFQINLNQIIQKIIGKTCNQVTFTYGDELLLDFGEMTPYNHPKLRHLRKGTWQLSTRATNFDLKKVPIKDTKDAKKNNLHLLENKKLTNFVIDTNKNFQLTCHNITNLYS
ncbi:hypothetical protein MEN41_01010 [Dolichospermum sp. ST_con]|nr:hypothetical protein [Dolichospermum sp. ST_con]MDD1418623.1 hypothetical protein [Dolichospermum sp. ST_sed1]MDD1425205.1 hypothetical protein [Dolichospermum sp. ST_sed9]MDD1429976.1 hypothetical protein [Dolichospermum sp. ST_sed6]MDD1437169.1 hypothetical protein [Dolichospermum sp. ST_sed10]MDD1439251.1 hypothetical protein [Dolichospermum sp. ST_sed3]MDD1445983.1 hypothetical protein [Dolichospermum sp. ST_sed8]MDD1454639.1 hypothetical protein [Dolichospermum sp. ST_sed7]MDD145944